MGQWRAEWQAYKKDHPSFEKSKGFKSDVGPALDMCEKDKEKVYKLLDNLKKNMIEFKKKGDLILESLTKYGIVVSELQQKDNSISGDFDYVIKNFREAHKGILSRVKKKTAVY